MLLRCLLCMYVFCVRTSGTLSAGEREPVCQEIIQNEVAAMPEKIIYPIQPYFVLSSAAYYKKLSGLPAVSHFYRFTGNQNSGQCFAVPDGAVDIIFKCSKDAPSAEIYENDGVIRVSELEQKLHYSRRHLVRSFEETTGLDIKSFSTYIRFQSVLKQLNEGRFKSLSEAAAAGGYFDQNHFQKDFKRFANITPGAYVKLLEDMRYQDKLIIL